MDDSRSSGKLTPSSTEDIQSRSKPQAPVKKTIRKLANASSSKKQLSNPTPTPLPENLSTPSQILASNKSRDLDNPKAKGNSNLPNGSPLKNFTILGVLGKRERKDDGMDDGGKVGIEGGEEVRGGAEMGLSDTQRRLKKLKIDHNPDRKDDLVDEMVRKDLGVGSRSGGIERHTEARARQDLNLKGSEGLKRKIDEEDRNSGGEGDERDEKRMKVDGSAGENPPTKISHETQVKNVRVDEERAKNFNGNVNVGSGRGIVGTSSMFMPKQKVSTQVITEKAVHGR
jgi:hypothetical protein